MVRIHKKTLRPYGNGKRTLGKGIGRPSLLSEDEKGLLCDVVRLYDRGRDMMGSVLARLWGKCPSSDLT
jgi:hypothetical protein